MGHFDSLPTLGDARRRDLSKKAMRTRKSLLGFIIANEYLDGR
jgi:hypothetical protein